MKRPVLLTILIFICGFISVNAGVLHQAFEPQVIDSTDQNNIRLMLLPILFRSPDTGFAVGVLPQVIFLSTETSNPSTLRMDTYYTQKNQYHFLLRSNNWIQSNQLNLTGKLSLRHWPTSFYGIGNNTSADWKESFTETLYDASLGLSKHVGSNLYLGGGALIRNGKVNSTERGGLLKTEMVRGTGNTFITGMNIGITYDSRDNHFFPTKGSYHKLNLFGSFRGLGSDHKFIKISMDVRKYFSISRIKTLAVRAEGIFSGGEVPFRMLPSIGGSLRGYSSARYIDRHMVSIQLEYRIVPVFWRLGLVVFAGTGDVFSNVDEIQFNNLKDMVGIGLRYVFFRDEKINIRFDVGIGRQSSGDYIDLSEAY